MVEDLQEYLSPFDQTKPATITIYADQPKAGSSIPVTIQGDPGHACISIKQNNINRLFGFYPGIKLLAAHITDSAIGNDQGHIYDASVSIDVSASQLRNIIQEAINYPLAYQLNLYNCTDYVIELGRLAGLDIPSCWGPYPSVIPGTFGGSNPGALGQYIRNLPQSDEYTITTETDNAPLNNG